jgi:phosphoribosylanthranilate isomerase
MVNSGEMTERTRLKICCISSLAEASCAIDAGADALGLVGHMPSGPGVIADALIREIAQATPPPIATFLLTSETDPDRVVAHVRSTGVNTIQLVDDAVTTEVYRALREETPAVRIVQVIHVIDIESVDRAREASLLVDAILLDSGNPAASTPELGGTGRAHDWSLSRTIVERAQSPVFLAGGLTPENVADAVQQVRPFGVDLCSGVRTDGALDAKKAKAFSLALRTALEDV